MVRRTNLGGTRMNKNTIACVAAALLLPVLGHVDNAEAKGKPEPPAARITGVPIHKVNAVMQVIEASGDPVDIYFPEVHEKKRAGMSDQFPVVVILQGALVENEFYSVLGQQIAKQGFVVMIPNHTSQFLDGRFTEITVVTEALEHARLEDLDPESPLYKITDPSRLGIGGHSFGAAAVLFSISGACVAPFCDPTSGFTLPSELKAAAAIAGATRGFPVDNTGIPTLMIFGTLDRSVPDNIEFYETLVPPRAMVQIEGANHFGMNDTSEPPGANTDRGEMMQPYPQSITASRFGRWTGLFFRAHIKNDEWAYKKIYRNRSGETGVVVTAER